MISLLGNDSKEHALVYARIVDDWLRAMPVRSFMGDESSQRAKYSYWRAGVKRTVSTQQFPYYEWTYQPSYCNKALNAWDSSHSGVVTGGPLVANSCSLLLSPAKLSCPVIDAANAVHANCVLNDGWLTPYKITADAVAYKESYPGLGDHSPGALEDPWDYYYNASNDTDGLNNSRWKQMHYFAWFLVLARDINAFDSKAIWCRIDAGTHAINAAVPTEVREYMKSGNLGYYLVTTKNGRMNNPLGDDDSGFDNYMKDITRIYRPRVKINLKDTGEAYVVSYGYEVWPYRDGG